jgi:peptide deformylase
MTVRKIISYFEHSDLLRKTSQPVQDFDKKVIALIRDLKDTLKANPDGVGLAAPQINVHKRVVVVCLGCHEAENCEPGPPTALVNPKIVAEANERLDFDGCLSFPGLFGETIRPHYLRVTGLDEHGKNFERIFEGFDAIMVHHEIDHLEGILFIDRVERMEDLYQVHKKENGELEKVYLDAFY